RGLGAGGGRRLQPGGERAAGEARGGGVGRTPDAAGRPRLRRGRVRDLRLGTDRPLVPVRDPDHGDLGAVDAGDAGAGHAPGWRRRAGTHPGRAEQPGEPGRHRRSAALYERVRLVHQQPCPGAPARGALPAGLRDAGGRGRGGLAGGALATAGTERRGGRGVTQIQRRQRAIALAVSAMHAIATIAVQKPRSPVSKNGVLKFIPSAPATTASEPSSTVTKVSARTVSLVRSALRVAYSSKLPTTRSRVFSTASIARSKRCSSARNCLSAMPSSLGRKSGRARAPNTCRCGASIRRRREAPRRSCASSGRHSRWTLLDNSSTSKRSTAASKSDTACR